MFFISPAVLRYRTDTWPMSSAGRSRRSSRARSGLSNATPASLCAVHAGLLAQANVVLYERALARRGGRGVCRLGVYAEPLPATGHTGPAIALRALQFASRRLERSATGRTVRTAGCRQLLRPTTEDLHRAGCDGNSPLLRAIGTITASRYRRRRDIRDGSRHLCRRAPSRRTAQPDLHAARARALDASAGPRRPPSGPGIYRQRSCRVRPAQGRRK